MARSVSAIQAARLVGVSERTIRQWIHNKKLPAVEVRQTGQPRTWAIDVDVLEHVSRVTIDRAAVAKLPTEPPRGRAAHTRTSREAMLERIEELERTVERLRERAPYFFAEKPSAAPSEANLSEYPIPTRYQPPKPRQRPVTPTRRRVDLPPFPRERLWLLSELEARYGCTQNSMRDAINSGHLQNAPGGPWDVGTPQENRYALDDEQAAAAVARYGGRSRSWQSAHPGELVPPFQPKNARPDPAATRPLSEVLARLETNIADESSDD